MRYHRRVLRNGILLLAFGCASPPAKRDDGGRAMLPADPMTPTIELVLRAKPETLPMAERSAFEIGFTATNRSPSVIDPGLEMAELTVNGEVSIDWRAAVGNGGREATWTALPPGESIEMDWNMGEQLFPGPGEYQLELRLGADKASPVKVVVTP
jgi:hypothetical protein